MKLWNKISLIGLFFLSIAAHSQSDSLRIENGELRIENDKSHTLVLNSKVLESKDSVNSTNSENSSHLLEGCPKGGVCPDKREINYTRLAIVGGSITAAYTLTWYYFLRDGWWAESVPFNFEPMHHDFHYASNADKFGHFYTGVLFSEIFAISYDWVGFSPFASSLLAGITLGATQVIVELKDGFSEYGYSVWDAAFGTLGGFYVMGKRFIPVMKYVDYKWTYWRHSEKYYDDAHAKNEQGFFIEDYINQTNWLSFKIPQISPFAVAVGIGISDELYYERYDKYIFEYYLAMDYDLEAIFRPKQNWAKNLVRVLNHVKLPAPTLKFYPKVKFYPVFPIQGISIAF